PGARWRRPPASVAVAMVHGPEAGHHRLEAARAHLLELVGDHQAAHAAYRLAAAASSARPRRRPPAATCRLPPARRCILSLPEQRYLRSRAARLRPQPAHDPSPAARHRKSVLRLGIMTVW